MAEINNDEINNDVIKMVIMLTKRKIDDDNLSIRKLAQKLDVNYPNLTRVLNGKLINYKIIRKLLTWVNE